MKFPLVCSIAGVNIFYTLRKYLSLASQRDRQHAFPWFRPVIIVIRTRHMFVKYESRIWIKQHVKLVVVLLITPVVRVELITLKRKCYIFLLTFVLLLNVQEFTPVAVGSIKKWWLQLSSSLNSKCKGRKGQIQICTGGRPNISNFPKFPTPDLGKLFREENKQLLIFSSILKNYIKYDLRLKIIL